MNTLLGSMLMEPPAGFAVVPPPDTVITDRIHLVRGQSVRLDRDLAELYGVEVKRLKEQVRRNSARFLEDFMFELTLEEAEASRSQFATLKRGANIKYLPFAFTEHGILMLANVLRSEQAIAVSIQIIRIFNRMREVVLSHKDILLQLKKLGKSVDEHDADIARIFLHLERLIHPPATPRKRIGYKDTGN